MIKNYLDVTDRIIVKYLNRTNNLLLEDVFILDKYYRRTS
jgi:hypothetical protein